MQVFRNFETSVFVQFLSIHCKESLLKSRELCLGSIPDLNRVDVRADHILQMRSHGPTINLGARSRLAHALSNVEDDAREPILINPDFLVVGDLAQLADVGKLLRKVADDGAAK